jgi:hypothetical protein
MRAMRVYSAPCAPVPPLRSPPSCLRASRHCLGGGPGPAVCVCVRIERVLRASHIAWGAYPPLLLSGGGLSGILHKSRLFPPPAWGGGPGPAKLCVCVCAFCARPPTPGAHSPPSPLCPQQAHSDAPLPPRPRAPPPLPGGACLRMLEAHLCVCSSCPGGGGGRSPIGARLPT